MSYEELLLLNRAKWAMGELQRGGPAEYKPPPVDGTLADAELRRLNTIIDVLVSATREQVRVPPGARLEPIKGASQPSKTALPPEHVEMKWDEFLTGLDQFDEGRRNSKGSIGSRPGSSASNRAGSRPGSSASNRAGSRPGSSKPPREPGSRPGSRQRRLEKLEKTSARD